MPSLLALAGDAVVHFLFPAQELIHDIFVGAGLDAPGDVAEFLGIVFALGLVYRLLALFVFGRGFLLLLRIGS